VVSLNRAFDLFAEDLLLMTADMFSVDKLAPEELAWQDMSARKGTV
jgi:hypothetical protein